MPAAVKKVSSFYGHNHARPPCPPTHFSEIWRAVTNNLFADSYFFPPLFQTPPRPTRSRPRRRPRRRPPPSRSDTASGGSRTFQKERPGTTQLSRLRKCEKWKSEKVRWRLWMINAAVASTHLDSFNLPTHTGCILTTVEMDGKKKEEIKDMEAIFRVGTELDRRKIVSSHIACLPALSRLAFGRLSFALYWFLGFVYTAW